MEEMKKFGMEMASKNRVLVAKNPKSRFSHHGKMEEGLRTGISCPKTMAKL